MKAWNNTIVFYLGFGLVIILALTASCSTFSSVLEPTPPLTINGTAYHDYNGDGIKEDDEPTIAGLELKFFDEAKKQSSVVVTKPGGIYNIQLSRGQYKLTVVNTVLGENDQPYRFLNISKEDFYSIDSPLDVEIKDNMTYDIKLMQGFLTLPFAEGTDSYLWYYFDVDKKDSLTRDWQGNTHTYDRHTGTDYIVHTNTPILAAAPGMVSFTGFDGNWGNTVIIKHKPELFTWYCHLDQITVKVGDIVNRGDKIALSGNSGRLSQTPHLHFQLDRGSKLNSSAMDPYRDIQNPLSVNWWTVDNSPQYP